MERFKNYHIRYRSVMQRFGHANKISNSFRPLLPRFFLHNLFWTISLTGIMFTQKSPLDEIIYAALLRKGGTLWKNGLNW